MPDSARPPKARTVAVPSRDAVARERERLKRRKRRNSFLLRALGALLAAVAVSALSATYLLPMLQVSGESMEPTLQNGDVVLLLKTGDFAAGDIVGLYWQDTLLLKRVIGTPGDVIDIAADGTVTVNGTVLDEPYVAEKALGTCDLTFPFQVPEDQYFVMGDNRAASLDSRTSMIGCIDKSRVVGRAVVRIYPLGRISLLP